ncbi:unknown [Prevotella sp. CAG:1031]|nr:unknown [Prevotella sp. CAG:1031]
MEVAADVDNVIAGVEDGYELDCARSFGIERGGNGGAVGCSEPCQSCVDGRLGLGVGFDVGAYPPVGVSFRKFQRTVDGHRCGGVCFAEQSGFGEVVGSPGIDLDFRHCRRACQTERNALHCELRLRAFGLGDELDEVDVRCSDACVGGVLCAGDAGDGHVVVNEFPDGGCPSFLTIVGRACFRIEFNCQRAVGGSRADAGRRIHGVVGTLHAPDEIVGLTFRAVVDLEHGASAVARR